jgi:hypothetical protein
MSRTILSWMLAAGGVAALLAASSLLPACLSAAAESSPNGGAPGPQVAHSSVCAQCHSNSPQASAMRDAAGEGIAPYDLWRGTMMANAARDPIWRAVVSAEVAATPSRRAEIEETCLSCHAPMAQRIGLEPDDSGSLMPVLQSDSSLGRLARDGVSCTVCHGMSPEGLGTEQSFSAGFALDPQRRLFGPHAEPFDMPMRRHTGFTPTQGGHVTESALCGSCHTLETVTFAPDGSHDGGRFLEQAPYLEWRNSSYDDERSPAGERAASCQDCHVPTADERGAPIVTRIARNPMGRDFGPTQERSPFGRHLVVGGNTLGLSLLRDHADELGVQAPREAFDALIAATREQLETRSARVTLLEPSRQGERLAFSVQVENLTGHKLPTAHPTRRAWLRVIVRDAQGGTVFASGTTDARGRILGAGGVPLPSERAGGPIEPHRDLIRSADEVAVFEAVMADADGAPTFTLMRGASWLVDSRLLPHGWDPGHAEAWRTASVGVDADESFLPGSDRVSFELRAVGEGPLSVEASLVYQPLSARWVDELFRWETPEIELLRSQLETADRTPEVLGTARRTLE